jgi:hypothetical protein
MSLRVRIGSNGIGDDQRHARRAVIVAMAVRLAVKQKAQRQARVA